MSLFSSRLSSIQARPESINNDHLVVHTHLKGQTYCLLSIALPETHEQIMGIKVLATCKTEAECTKLAKQVRDSDRYHNVFIGQTGFWTPVDLGSLTEPVPDALEKLNENMKVYKDRMLRRWTEAPVQTEGTPTSLSWCGGPQPAPPPYEENTTM